jgi:hypothetical protein
MAASATEKPTVGECGGALTFRSQPQLAPTAAVWELKKGAPAPPHPAAVLPPPSAGTTAARTAAGEALASPDGQAPRRPAAVPPVVVGRGEGVPEALVAASARLPMCEDGTNTAAETLRPAAAVALAEPL